MENINSNGNSSGNSSGSWVDFVLTRGPIRGENRNKIGLILKVQARREVEDFMSGLAEGHRTPVDAIGDSWYNLNSIPLEVYDAAIDVNNQKYTLSGVGLPLLITQEGRLRGPQEDQINLSFLKLAGISNPEGVNIAFVGAYSSDYVQKVRGVMGPAIRQFLLDYLTPITINLSIINKE